MRLFSSLRLAMVRKLAKFEKVRVSPFPGLYRTALVQFFAIRCFVVLLTTYPMVSKGAHNQSARLEKPQSQFFEGSGESPADVGNHATCRYAPRLIEHVDDRSLFRLIVG